MLVTGRCGCFAGIAAHLSNRACRKLPKPYEGHPTYRLQASIRPNVFYGPLARYVKFWAAHAPWMPGTVSPPPRFCDPDMHHGTRVTHVPWCLPGSLTSGLFWSWWRAKRSRHSRRIRNPKFYVTGKRPIGSPSNSQADPSWWCPVIEQKWLLVVALRLYSASFMQILQFLTYVTYDAYFILTTLLQQLKGFHEWIIAIM